VQASGNFDLRAQQPPGPVEHSQHLRAASGADRLSERGERAGACGNRDGRELQPDGLARAWRHKGIEVAPWVAMLYHHSWTLPAGTPDATHEGFEAGAVR
jgi:hypothetical protein